MAEANARLLAGMTTHIGRCVVQIHHPCRIILAKEQGWALSGVSEEEIARFRPSLVADAQAICDQLRADHLARSPQP